ncbi:hypothetical protein A0H81_06960 [Grifola frondosa]|uniref:DUF6534 domain-containing protein n=1 Tax=Grifola frondosa TaxID=5627 RepID=A0A1C7M780_GRIFR|nr:hypothetical protein A0H81_06960 [Grifola frondosa]
MLLCVARLDCKSKDASNHIVCGVLWHYSNGIWNSNLCLRLDHSAMGDLQNSPSATGDHQYRARCGCVRRRFGSAVPYILLAAVAKWPSVGEPAQLDHHITVNTGALTSIISVLSVILFATEPHSLAFLALTTIQSKLYSVSFLGSLNARQRIRNNMQSSPQVFPSVEFSDRNTMPATSPQIEVFRQTVVMTDTTDDDMAGARLNFIRTHSCRTAARSRAHITFDPSIDESSLKPSWPCLGPFLIILDAELRPLPHDSRSQLFTICPRTPVHYKSSLRLPSDRRVSCDMTTQ